eukprot:CAMPEP_0194051042 /NCGR_PEP_ID=MMETSP0009_2-20130614/38150_1 /TAXON_ID=210454 /ORGANISM="Grammatophora oceanica, Strain CCMP 410" /LENGTH=40 /DNA_ID= /DNA_START= /DNA_END= /DNA_ORIENTATION=
MSLGEAPTDAVQDTTGRTLVEEPAGAAVEVVEVQQQEVDT